MKKIIWEALLGGLPTLLFGYSFLDWEWWVYVLTILIGAFWAFGN